MGILFSNSIITALSWTMLWEINQSQSIINRYDRCELIRQHMSLHLGQYQECTSKLM